MLVYQRNYKIIGIILGVILIPIFAIAISSSQNNTENVPKITIYDVDKKKIAKSLHEIFNQKREDVGKENLYWKDDLARAAEQYSKKFHGMDLRYGIPNIEDTNFDDATNNRYSVCGGAENHRIFKMIESKKTKIDTELKEISNLEKKLTPVIQDYEYYGYLTDNKFYDTVEEVQTDIDTYNKKLENVKKLQNELKTTLSIFDEVKGRGYLITWIRIFDANSVTANSYEEIVNQLALEKMKYTLTDEDGKERTITQEKSLAELMQIEPEHQSEGIGITLNGGYGYIIHYLC